MTPEFMFLTIYVVGFVITWFSYEVCMSYKGDTIGQGIGWIPAFVWPLLLATVVIFSPFILGNLLGDYLRRRKTK